MSHREKEEDMVSLAQLRDMLTENFFHITVRAARMQF